MSYTFVDEYQAKHWQPRVIVLNEKNAVVSQRGI